jgi:hypothetical protein
MSQETIRNLFAVLMVFAISGTFPSFVMADEGKNESSQREKRGGWIATVTATRKGAMNEGRIGRIGSATKATTAHISTSMGTPDSAFRAAITLHPENAVFGTRIGRQATSRRRGAAASCGRMCHPAPG